MELEDFIAFLELYLLDCEIECESEDPIMIKVTKGKKGIRLMPSPLTLSKIRESDAEVTVNIIKRTFERGKL